MKHLRVVLVLLPAFMFCAYPLGVVVSANIGTLPLDVFVIGRWMVVAFGAVIIIVWLLKTVQPDLAARAMWVNWFLLVLVFYESAVHQWRLLGFRLGFATSPYEPKFALTFVLAALILATVVSQPWRVHSRNPMPLNLFAAALLSVTLYPAALSAIADDANGWREPSDALINSSLSTSLKESAGPIVGRAADIYYIIPDGLGRADILDELYDTDLTSFVTFLEKNGFYVADNARANYAQTYLSLASTLNMNYLGDVAAAMRTSRDRRPLHYLIQKNALMRAARSAGYRVVGISSDYMATERWDSADICVCPRYGPDEIELAAIAKSPLAALPFDRWAYDAHRRKVFQSIAAIETSSSHDAPIFLIAHIIVPHPPFVIGPEGSPRRPSGKTAFSFSDGDQFAGSNREYVNGYRDQVRFVTAQLTTLVESLLRRPGVPPIIVIHGDHGPGSMLSWNTPHGTNMRERMGIFAAYRFPDSSAALYPSISPVNGARILATRYLGLELPLLPDHSFFSTWNHPYDFLPVETAGR